MAESTKEESAEETEETGNETPVEELTTTDVDEVTVVEMVRHWHRVGRPEYGNRLKALFQAGDEIPYYLLDRVGVRSEKDITGKLEVPPRSGRGSGVVKWREFAAQVSDMAPEVLNKMERGEIIEFLESREIIPEEEEGENGEGGGQEENDNGDSNGDSNEDSVPEDAHEEESE